MIRRQYFNAKVWMRDHLLQFVYLYLAGVFLTIVSLSFLNKTVETGILSVAPLILIIVLAVTRPIAHRD